MEPLRRLADGLDHAATTFGGTRPDEWDPAQPAGPGPGAPGEVTADLHRQVTAALHARTREASAAAAATADLAARLRTVAAGYTDADESAAGKASGLGLS